MSGATPGGYDYANGVYDFSSWKEIVEEAAKLYADGSVLPGSENQGVDNSRALFAQGAFAAVSNSITAVVVGGLLVLAYTRTIAKKGSLDQE